MLAEMNKKLIKEIKQAKAQGELTAHKIYDITHQAALESTNELKSNLEHIKETSKEIIAQATSTLEESGEASSEKISAAVHGAIDGIKISEAKFVDKAKKDLVLAKKKLSQEEANLAESLTEAFLGAKQAVGDCSSTLKQDLDKALHDAKLNSIDLLGLTKQTVKEAINLVIEAGKDVENIVENTTREAVSNAMKEASFSANRARRISETVLLAAIESAQESNKYIKEVTNAAVEGVRKGLADSVEFTQHELINTEVSVEEYIQEDIEQTKLDIENVSELFVVLRKVADKSDQLAKNILHDAADDAQKIGCVLQEKAHSASQVAAKKLTELGYEAVKKTEVVAHKISEESKELAERMFAVAKGATTGMWAGAKAAFYKKKAKNDKSGDA
ncbi:MAG: hypothetical protein RPR97_11350 [Colwellia sp.]